MSTIQPPGGPKGPTLPKSPAVEGSGGPASTATEGVKTAATSGGSTAPVGNDPSRAILDALRASKITPDEAVRRLTDAAVTRAGCPPSLRPTVEARMRSLLANDPLIGSLLRQAGASVPTPDE